MKTPNVLVIGLKKKQNIGWTVYKILSVQATCACNMCAFTTEEVFKEQKHFCCLEHSAAGLNWEFACGYDAFIHSPYAQSYAIRFCNDSCLQNVAKSDGCNQQHHCVLWPVAHFLEMLL